MEQRHITDPDTEFRTVRKRNEEKSPPLIVSYQKWVIIGIAVLFVAVLVMIIVIGWIVWNLSSNVQLDTTTSVPKQYDQYILKTDFKQTLKTVEDMEKTLQDLTKEWKVPKHEWGELNKKVEQMLKESIKIKSENEQMTNDVDRIKSSMGEMESDMTNLKSSTDELKKQIAEFHQQMEQAVNSMKTVINTKIQDVQKAFEDEYVKLAKGASDKLTLYEEQFIERMKNLKTEHNQKLDAVEKTLKTDFRAKYDDLDPLIQDVKSKVDDVIMPNLLNKQNVAAAVVIAMFGVVVFYFIQRGNTAQTNEKSSNGRVVTQSMVDVPPLRRQVPNVSLQNAICVVSFNENTQEHHKQLVNQVTQGLSPRLLEKCPLRYHIVRNHDHIDQLQPAKLYMLFDNFSERHVIIEEPGIGQGDLKRTTVHAISQLQADYIIIYVRDPGSKGLTANARYNKDIYSVQNHGVLRMLNQRGRFFSLFDSLSQLQIGCIQAIINDTF